MKRSYFPILLCTFLLGCLTNKKATLKTDKIYETRLDSINMLDNSRNRLIPVALYLPQSDQKIAHQQLVIFSHGYYANRGVSNRACSYLTEFLASRGYFVASIQHELPTDDLIPTQGIPQVVRRPFWERGVQNILFVLNELKKNYPELDYQHVILIGHSNGGDMSMLFGQEHPTLVDKIISLDNRRVAFPRTQHPKIYSLRSSDQLADEGVLPTPEEQKKQGTRIIQLKNTPHNSMDNSGTEEQKKEINTYILGFLNDPTFSQTPKLTISPLTDHFYIYTTSKTYPDTPPVSIPANGMYWVTDQGVVLFDTPFDTTQFQPLLDSILVRHHQKVVLCIATHSHEDRSAGLEYYTGKGIRTYTTQQTDEFSKQRHEKRAAHLMYQDTVFTLGREQFQTFYPGAGHTSDNIVIWFEREKILYGGCFIKSTEAKDLGNLKDANVPEWSRSIKRVQHKFGKPRYIIPGHFGWESKRALKHTLKLIRKYKREAGIHR